VKHLIRDEARSRNVNNNINLPPARMRQGG
jgi:hypothetical protein